MFNVQCLMLILAERDIEHWTLIIEHCEA